MTTHAKMKKAGKVGLRWVAAFVMLLSWMASGLAPAAPAQAVALPTCFAEYTGDNATDFSSADAKAVRDAVLSATTGSVVKIAGTCAGVTSIGSLSLVVGVDKSLTLRGGYTTTNWLATPNAVANPTVLDAVGAGRVITASKLVTIENLTLQNGVGSYSNNQTVFGYGGGLYARYSAFVSNTTFYNNRSDGLTSPTSDRGGALAVLGDVTIIASRFISNTAGMGGGIYVQGTTELVNTDFISNVTGSTSNGGGAAYIGGGSIIGGVFRENRAAAEGGALWASIPKTFVVSGTQFLSNTSTNWPGGGAAYFAYGTTDGTMLFLTNTTFVSNTATAGPGGGVHIDQYVDFLISGSRFERNVARTSSGQGGAVYSYGTLSATARIENSLFQRNASTDRGGAVYAEAENNTSYNVPLEIVNSTFLTNTAMGASYAGAAAIFRPAIISGSMFISNTSGQAGALYVTGGLTMANSELRRNWSGQYSGALEVENGAYIVGTTFAENSACCNGGAARVAGLNVISGTQVLSNVTRSGGTAGIYSLDYSIITNTTFSGNRANGSVGALQSDFAILNNVRSVDNVADYAAGMYLEGGGELTDVSLERNVSPDYAAGAYLYAWYKNFTITNLYVAENATTGSGGGIYIEIEGGDALVQNSRFYSNTAADRGAAIFFMSEQGTLNLVNNIIADNAVLTPTTGGDVAADSTTPMFLNGAHNTFVAATPGAGTGLSFGSEDLTSMVTATNNLFSGYGLAMDARNTLTATLDGALLEGVTTPTSGTVTASRVVTGSAGFVDAAARNYLAIGDGVDAGADSGVAEDIRGLARPQGGIYDLGAYEARSARLAELSLTPGALSPAFVSSTTSYAAQVPNGTTSTAVTATAADVSATVVYSSSAGACAAGTCDIAGPKTWITVTVTAADGLMTKQYVVEVTAASSSSANLVLLGSTNGAIDPTFVSETLTYTLGIAYGWTSIVVFATPEDANATYVISSTAGACSSGVCDVASGVVTTITVEVTAQDGVTKKTYAILVSVAGPNGDASLSALAIDPGTLEPAFVSTTTQYTGSVPAGTGSVIVTSAANGPDAQVVYASSAGECKAQSSDEDDRGARAQRALAVPVTCAVSLIETTWITATVTAQDGTVQEYVIVIPYAALTGGVSGLSIDPGTLNPAFVSSTTSYAANVPAGTSAVTVTAEIYGAADVMYESSAGLCEGPVCEVAGPKTWITVTAMVDGETAATYFIEVTVAAPLTTIDRVWPGTGLPEGGMPVQIFGSGFVMALTVTVDGASVPFTIENDGRIEFVMPPGVAGQSVSVTVQTADDAQTAVNAFTYVQPEMIEFDGETGGVFTTTDGVVVEIPSQGVAGMFVITMTPLPPAPGVPGNILMYSFRLDALLNWVPLASLTNPVTIRLPVDENIFAISDGERPWLYQWTTDDGRRTADDGGRRSAVGGRWVLVRGQQYDPGTKLMTVDLKPMGVYALSTAYVRTYWFPVVPVVK